MKIKNFCNVQIKTNHLQPTFKKGLETNTISKKQQEENQIQCIIVHPIIFSVFENYETAQKIFRKNLENNTGIFGDFNNPDQLLKNDKIRRNVVQFFAQYSKEKLKEIEDKKLLTLKEIEELQTLKEVNKFFEEFLQSWTPIENKKAYNNSKYARNYNIAFAGNMNEKDEKHCYNVVHGFSLGCAAISAALGEGAAIGADTPFLRIAQFAMFTHLADYLNVPAFPSLEYYTKEMFAGATLGVNGAKLVTSWLGIGGHAVSTVTGTTLTTAGGSDAIISGGVRAVNGTLSGLITEKMGRGYISRVKRNKMTFKEQTKELGFYFGRAMMYSGEKNPLNLFKKISYGNPSDPDDIKDAILKLPKGYVEASSSVLETICQKAVSNAGIFAMDTALIVLSAASEPDKEKRKKEILNGFREALVRTVVYELCSESLKSGISKEATRTIEDIRKNLEKYPEVYHTFIEKEAEFIKQINLETLSTDAFVNQFKNRTFMRNYTNLCQEIISEFEIAWINRNGAKRKKDFKSTQQRIDEANANSKNIGSKLSQEDQDAINKLLKDIEIKLKNQYDYIKSSKGFGYGKIAGYEDIKEILTNCFISPLSTNASLGTDIPSAILFYGPTNVGKTELAKAVAEQGKCNIKTLMDVDNLDELRVFLTEIADEAKKSSRHTVLRIDEFDEFGSDDELVDIFLNFMKNSKNNRVTLMLTTNEPLDISNKILKEVISIPILPSDKKNILQLLKYYGLDLTEEDYNQIADTMLKKAGESAYSNMQILDMCISAKQLQPSNLKECMLKLISINQPEISKQDIIKLQNEIAQMKELQNED